MKENDIEEGIFQVIDQYILELERDDLRERIQEKIENIEPEDRVKMINLIQDFRSYLALKK